MKFIFILMTVCFSQAFAATKMKTIYEGDLNWEDKYRLKIFKPDTPDSLGFTGIRILKDKKTVFERWLKEGGGDTLNILPVDAVAAGPLQLIPLDSEKSKAGLFFSETAAEPAPSKLIIVGIDLKGDFYTIFSASKTFEKLEDYNGDGLRDLLVKGGNGEINDKKRELYVPYQVYRQVRARGTISFIPDQRLSKKWSLENKYPWLGFYPGKNKLLP